MIKYKVTFEITNRVGDSLMTIEEYRKLLIGEVEKNNKRLDELLGVEQ